MGLNIGVCMKVVPDPEKYHLMRMDPETKRLIRDGVESVIGSADLHAIEMALQIKEKFGGEITLISMGIPSNEKQLREGLGYGCDKAVLISDRKLGGADALATSYSLAKGIEKLGGFDLVLLGNASDDGATAHVPTQVGEMLGVPHITDVQEYEMNDESSITVSKQLGNLKNTYKVALPAVLGVTKRINKVRHPSVMQIFAAKNKPLDTLTAADLDDLDETRIGLDGSPTRTVGYEEADFHRECIEITGDASEKAAEILKIIQGING